MRRTSHTTPRLAFTGAGCLLILIAGFGFWSLADAAGKIEQIRHLNAESDAYDAASDAVAVEDFLLTEALVALHPEARKKLPIVRLREEHAQAAADLLAALEQITGRAGTRKSGRFRGRFSRCTRSTCRLPTGFSPPPRRGIADARSESSTGISTPSSK